MFIRYLVLWIFTWYEACGAILDFRTMSFFSSGHQNVFASISIFVISELSKSKTTENRLLRPMGTTIRSSTNTRPQRSDSLSNTGLFRSVAGSRSPLRMLLLTRMSPWSVVVFELTFFRSIIIPNSEFFKFWLISSTQPVCFCHEIGVNLS